MSDVFHFQTADGGELVCANGQIELTDDLSVAAYLSLFGGNEDDSGQEADDAKQWWGNLSEKEPANRYRSETQHLLLTLPTTPANLQRFEEAAAADLSWITESIATDLAVVATMPAPKRVDLLVSVVIDGKTTTFPLKAL
jgi:phage gp46-like protein